MAPERVTFSPIDEREVKYEKKANGGRYNGNESVNTPWGAIYINPLDNSGLTGSFLAPTHIPGGGNRPGNNTVSFPGASPFSKYHRNTFCYNIESREKGIPFSKSVLFPPS